MRKDTKNLGLPNLEAPNFEIHFLANIRYLQ